MEKYFSIFYILGYNGYYLLDRNGVKTCVKNCPYNTIKMDGNCIFEDCPNGYFYDPKNGKKNETLKHNSTYFLNGLCSKCNSKCKECVGPTSYHCSRCGVK